jgi:subtilase family serine protease
MIRVVRFLPLFVLAMATVSITAKAESVAPKVRIVDAIDEGRLAALKGNTHPAATAKNDVGKVSDALPMSDLILVLSRDSDQQAAFEKFVASQYDSNSPNFHQWLLPAEVGEQFGPSQTDIATITNWLTGHGLTVNAVSKDRMSIRFSGTAAQVQSTFHTEVHNLLVKGVPHVANMSDPQIPAALTTVVVGVKALHNFFPRPAHHLGQLVQKDAKSGGWMRMPSTTGTPANGTSTARPTTQATGARPQFGISPSGQGYLVEDVDPWDFATIYDILPLWNASTPINGAGQTIAVAGTSDVNPTDIATFRRFFGLPPYTSANQPQIIHPLPTGDDPTVAICTSGVSTAPCGLSDLLENSLDVEWTGAIAPAAQIILVNGIPQTTTDDNLYDAEDYIVQNVDTLNARIINVSYGECELANGTAGNVEYYDMWQTAAAEGISVFVAAGDSGSASCDDGGDAAGVPYSAEFGNTVSGLASTPYNTAVGGTDFNWCSLTSAAECTPAPYWGTNSQSKGSTEAVTSALGYVPETPWNQTCTNPLVVPFLEQFFGTGTVYAGDNGDTYGVNDAEEGCNAIYYNTETLFEIGDSGFLSLVDTVGGSGGASSCVANTTTATAAGSCSVGATTTGTTTNSNTNAPQGALTLVNNGWPKPAWQTGVAGIPGDGVRDLPDVSFFASDGFISDSAYLICVSEASEDPQCSYSSSTEPFAQEIGGTSVATPAMAAVMALINQKTGESQGLAGPELYKLASTQTYSACSAETIAANSTAPNKCYFNDIDTGTIAMPCDATDGSPNCNVIHSGDYVGILSGYSAGPGYDQATGLGSLNVANVVNAWPQTLGAGKATVAVTPGQTTLNSNNTLNVTVTLTSNPTGGVTPTGSVTLTASGSTYTQTANSSTGSYSFTIPANALSAGAITLTASYTGDSVYSPTSNTATITVVTVGGNGLIPTVTVAPASATLNSSGSLSVVVTVAGTSGTPTGTVILSGGGYTSPSESLTNGTYTFTIPANSLASGSDTLSVSYGGDSNYAAVSGTAIVTVTESTFTLNLPAVTVTPATIAPGASATAVVTVAATSGYAGTVTLTCQQTGGPSTGDGTSCTLAGGAGVTLSSGTTSGTVTFSVSTAAPVAAVTYPQIRKNGWAGAGTGAVLAVLMLIGIPARRKSWRQMLGVLVLMTALGGLAGCGGSSTTSGGGGGNTDPGTAAGTYTYTVQATGNPSVTPAVSTTFNVVVN